MEQTPLLKMTGIEKEFPGVKALDNVHLEVYAGEVHAICGENGAGKSTLMNILAGLYSPSNGKIEYEGKPVEFKNHAQALEYGISIVYQERSLSNNLTIAENIFANRQATSGGLINRKRMNEQARKVCEMIHFYRPVTELVDKISPAEQQMVEIAKALSINSKLLILDEPTATISNRERDVLFDVIKKLVKEHRLAVIYISHRLPELFLIADKVTVMKDGKYIGTECIGDLDSNKIIKMMVGRDLVYNDYTADIKDEVVLEGRNLTGKRFRNVSFTLRKGEILGFSGLAGAGRTEVFRALIGADKLYSGEIFIRGVRHRLRTPKDAIKYGVSYLPEERRDQGLFLYMSIAQNIISANLPSACGKSGVINKGKISAIADEYKTKLCIITPSVEKEVSQLSGGNQQKVVFAKWLLVDTNIMIIDEPTRGIDVGAKSEIYRIIREMAHAGKSIVIISSELPEVMTISDRIAVMCDGRLVGIIDKKNATEEKIMQMSSCFDVE